MDNIITKKGNEYVVLVATERRCAVIAKEKYDGRCYNARDVRDFACKPEQLASLLDQLGF